MQVVHSGYCSFTKWAPGETLGAATRARSYSERTGTISTGVVELCTSL
jgi:hypothetical protein